MIRADPDAADIAIRRTIESQELSDWPIDDLYADSRIITSLVNDLVVSIRDEHPVAIKSAIRRLTDPVYRISNINIDRFIDTIILEHELSPRELIVCVLDRIVYAPYSSELDIQPPINLSHYSSIFSDDSYMEMREVMYRLKRWYVDLYEDRDEYDMLNQMRYRAIRLYSSLIDQGVCDRVASQCILASILEREDMIEEVLMDMDTNQDLIRLTKYRTRLFN